MRMTSNLAGSLSEGTTRLVVLAPDDGSLGSTFENIHVVPTAHRRLLNKMQRFRGQIALEEAAIRQDQLTPDGRHYMEIDLWSWHLVLLEGDEVVGAMRYAAYPNTVGYADLQVRQSWLAHTPEWGFDLKASVESTLAEARRRGVHVGEPGGWVLASALRNGREAIRLALGAFALAWNLGGAVGVCTATKRNHSAAMLRRLGGRSLSTAQGDLPAYHEPHYGCEMEILRFDSWSVNPSFQPSIDALSLTLARDVPVLAAGPPALGMLARRINSFGMAVPAPQLAVR